MRSIVSSDHPGVKLGFGNLKMLCQIKRIKHDDIENLLFESYKPETKVSITDLREILASKVQIGVEEAQYFARYLIEPRDEELISVNLALTTAACKIVIRLMQQIGEIMILSPEEAQQNMGVLKRCLKEMGRGELMNRIEMYQLPNSKSLGMTQISQIAKIDDRAKISCMIEFCRQADSLTGFDPQNLIDLYEKIEETKKDNKFSPNRASAPPIVETEDVEETPI
jgi:hypothetical protein